MGGYQEAVLSAGGGGAGLAADADEALSAGQLARSIELYGRALDAGYSDAASCYAQRAVAWQRAGEKRRALADLDFACGLCEGAERLAQLLFDRGQLRRDLDDFSGAAADFLSAQTSSAGRQSPVGLLAALAGVNAALAPPPTAAAGSAYERLFEGGPLRAQAKPGAAAGYVYKPPPRRKHSSSFLSFLQRHALAEHAEAFLANDVVREGDLRSLSLDDLSADGVLGLPLGARNRVLCLQGKRNSREGALNRHSQGESNAAFTDGPLSAAFWTFDDAARQRQTCT